MASGSSKSPQTPDVEEKVLLLLGPSGAGKSMAANYLACKVLFPIRDSPVDLTDETTRQHKFQHGETKVHLIDTVGFNETSRSDKKVLTELTTAVLMAADAGGIHQFLICVDVKSELLPVFSSDVQNALDDMDKMRTIWPYVMLLFTHAGKCGKTERQRRAEIDEFISTRCPDSLTWLVTNVDKQRTVIIEFDDVHLTKAPEILAIKLNDIMYAATASFKQGGVYSNSMMKDAKRCWEEYKFSKLKIGRSMTDLSYRKLALRIVDNMVVPPGRATPFSQIHRGIQEYRRKRHEAYLAEAQLY